MNINLTHPASLTDIKLKDCHLVTDYAISVCNEVSNSMSKFHNQCNHTNMKSFLTPRDSSVIVKKTEQLKLN